MVSLFPSFQYIEADGSHCLHHGTTIKSMRIVHPPSRKICFPANCSHWYFLIPMRYGWNKNVVAQIQQLKGVQPFPRDYTCGFPLCSLYQALSGGFSASHWEFLILPNKTAPSCTGVSHQWDQTKSSIHTAKQEFGIQSFTTPEKTNTGFRWTSPGLLRVQSSPMIVFFTHDHLLTHQVILLYHSQHLLIWRQDKVIHVAGQKSLTPDNWKYGRGKIELSCSFTLGTGFYHCLPALHALCSLTFLSLVILAQKKGKEESKSVLTSPSTQVARRIGAVVPNTSWYSEQFSLSIADCVPRRNISSTSYIF